MPGQLFDEIGYWSEIKLDIIKEYAQAYSAILSKKRLQYFYIDAFAGAGQHLSKAKGEMVPGSPLNALRIQPSFSEYFFIDINGAKIGELQRLASEDPETIHVVEGDCNECLVRDILPRVKYEEYKRALCLLDPYGLDLDWEVIATAGRMRTIEIFLNFPVADINRNVLWRHPEKVGEAQITRMNRYWGGESWREGAYSRERNLFGYEEKNENEVVAQAFRERLLKTGGFAHVPEPIPMRNSKGAIVYYLYFASQRPVADKIVKDIFAKYRLKGR